MEIIIGVAVAIVIFVVGGLIASAGNPPTVTPGVGVNGTDCNELCNLVNQRRAERCMAEADATDAQARVDNLATQLESAAVAAAVALAAAYVALSTPIAGLFIAPAFFAVASVLATYALGLLGALNTAERDRQDKVEMLRVIRTLEAQARSLLSEECFDTRDRCLSSVPSCS